MAVDVRTTPLGRPAVEVLQRVIARAKRGDPLAPVTVVVPSHRAGLSTRRLLGSRPGGLVNVRFESIRWVSELLAAPLMAVSGRRPLSGAVRAEAIRAALGQAPGLLARVAAHPATVAALDRTLADLRPATPAALDAVAATGARAAEVVALHRAVRRHLAPRWYDGHDLADTAAAAAAAGSPALAELGHVVVYCPRALPASVRALVDTLGPQATVIERDPCPRQAGDLVVAAADPDEEVRAAVRLVLARARTGIPLHRMAILWPADEPYALLARQHLAAAGIPHNGPAARPLARTAAGSALAGLLALPDRRFRRDDVMAWLAGAPVLADGRRPVPAAAWDAVSRSAGVVAGLDQWESRLARHSAALAERHRLLAADEEADEGRRRRLEDEVEQTQALRLFLEELAVALDAGERSSWAELSRWACSLLDRYLGAEAGHGGWPEDEKQAWADVRRALEDLGALDAVGGPVDVGRLRHAVEHQLLAPAGPVGRFGTGVFTAPLGAALATDFDVVVVVGMAEGTLPGRRSEDALLPDAERAAAGGQVGLWGHRIDEEWADYQAALAAATTERILVWPRTDPRRRRTRLPSRWLFEGDPPRQEVASFQAGLASGEPASLTDHDLGSLLRWTQEGGAAADHLLAAELPRFGAGLATARGRDGARFTRFDGHVGEDLVEPFPPGATHSPTSLEHYATCPMRYFLGHVLGLGEQEKPEDLRRIRATDKGTLVHKVLEDYVDGVLAGQPRSLPRLLDLAEREFGDYQARGLTGAPLLWRYERELVRRELTRFFAEDDLTPLATELVFGADGQEPVTVTLAGGRQVSFRGQVDRVDRAPGGGLCVTDYKTGSGRGYEEIEKDPVAGGRRLQLPLYGLAARARFGGDPVEARYWVVSEKADFKRVGITVDEAVEARLHEVVGVMVGGITAGRFPARPGEEDWRGGWDHCRFCAFDRLCQADRDRRWERVRSSPELASYVAMAEPGEEA